MVTPEREILIQTLLQTHGQALVLYARSFSGEGAEDLVQDAFLRLLKEEPFPEQPKSWLYRVVRNRGIDLTRKKRHHKRYELQRTWFQSSGVGQSGEITSEDATEALQRLSLETREIVISRIWGKLTFREIAELTGRSLSAVHQEYQSGIDTLRALLNEGEP